MKVLSTLFVIALLAGCTPPPMNDAEAAAFAACLEKEHTPRFFANVGKRDVTCLKPN